MASRIDIVEVDVLASVLLRVQTELGLNDRQCYPVRDVLYVPVIPPGGDYFVTISVGDGIFNEGEQIPQQCIENSEFTVSGFTRIKTDSTGHDGYMLTDASRGTLPIKRKILKALVGKDLEDADGTTFLRQLVFAKRASAPEIVEIGDKGVLCGVVRITFGIKYDWNLA
jgi:hypothetical protein